MNRYRDLATQFIGYCLAGGIAFVADYWTMVLLVEHFGTHYLAAATVGFMVGSIVCYAISSGLVFREHRYRSKSDEVFVFVLIGVGGLAFNNLVMWVATDGLGVPYQMSKLVAGALVLIFNFSFRRLAVFTAVPPRAEPLSNWSRFRGQ